jgi:hypothetical protein
MRRVMTLGLMALALLLAVGVGADRAAATKTPTFKKAPTFTEINSLNVTGSFSGLQPSTEAPDGTMVFVIGYGEMTVDCFDASNTLLGESTAPFYNLRAELYIPDSQLRSNTSFSVTTAPAFLTPEKAGCPAGTAYTVSRDVTFFSAHVGVDQGGYIVLQWFYYL